MELATPATCTRQAYRRLDDRRAASDDAGVFGADPAPVQFTPATAVPVGNINALYTSYFDMDGYDSVTGGSARSIWTRTRRCRPIYRAAAQLDCVRNARHLELSFNDDDITGWRAPLAPRVPTEGPSPVGNIYGTTALQDELIALELGIAGGFPAAVVSSAGSLQSAWYTSTLSPTLTAAMPRTMMSTRWTARIQTCATCTCSAPDN